MWLLCIPEAPDVTIEGEYGVPHAIYHGSQPVSDTHPATRDLDNSVATPTSQRMHMGVNKWAHLFSCFDLGVPDLFNEQMVGSFNCCSFQYRISNTKHLAHSVVYHF